MWRGGGGQSEQEGVSSPGAVPWAGGFESSGLVPGAWVSPARPLRGRYHGAGAESPGLSSMWPLGQAGEQREGSGSGDPLAQRGSLGVSSPCRGWAGQKNAVERVAVVSGGSARASESCLSRR